MKHVEFMGLPGSGKSTLWREAFVVLRSLGEDAVRLDEATRIAVRDRGRDKLTRLLARVIRRGSSGTWKKAYDRSIDRFVGLHRFLSCHPCVGETVLAAQRNRIERDLSPEYVLDWAFNLFAAFQLAKEILVDQTLVIDEGFANRGVSLFSHGFAEEDRSGLLAYVAAIPLPDAVFLVDTPIDVCRARLDKRGWTERLINLDASSRHAFLVRAGLCVDLISQELVRRGSKVIRIDGSRPVEETRQTMATVLGHLGKEMVKI